MTHVTCRLTAKNRNHTLGNRVCATFTFFIHQQVIEKEKTNNVQYNQNATELHYQAVSHRLYSKRLNNSNHQRASDIHYNPVFVFRFFE